MLMARVSQNEFSPFCSEEPPYKESESYFGRAPNKRPADDLYAYDAYGHSSQDQAEQMSFKVPRVSPHGFSTQRYMSSDGYYF